MTPNPAPHAQAITAFQAGPDTATGTPPTRPRRTTVLIILDAARADYVRPDTMPFLHGLSRQSMHGALESPPGFAQRTVLFSGRYPDTSGRFSQFVFDPEASPFAWTRALGPLRHLVKARRRYVPARHAIAAVTKLATGAEHPDPAWIPGRYLPFFRPCEDMRPIHDPGATGGTSIFDLARAHALSYRYLAHPVSGDDDAVHRTLVRDLRKGTPRDLYVAQFSVTDQKGHTHGPFSPEMETKHLRELDRKLATIHAALAAGYDEWDLLLVGDHGMAPVRRRLDIQAALKTIAAVPGKDYVVFVNSTLAVFWYLTPKGRRDVERLVANLPDVEPLDTEDRKAARIPTDRAWGDRMVAATPGLLFWPDYFHVKSANIVGMHGYLDKSQEGNGIAVLASSRTGLPTRNFGVRPLVDVFPTLCDLLGVPVPDGQEGTSLLTRTTRARHLLQEEPAFGAVGPAPTAPEPAHAEPTLAMPSTSALEPRGLGPIAGDGQLVLEADATTGQTSQPSIRLVELAPSAASARALSTSRGAAAHGATSPQGGEAAVAMAVVEDAAPDAT